jgi:amino acid transporter
MTAASQGTGAAPDSVASEGLVRAIGRWTMVALVFNMVVGAGIYGLPARVHAEAGVWGLLAYVACAAVIGCITLCFGEVASRFTRTGGPYLYTTEALGPLPGFLVGWLMTITRMTSLAIIATVMADYLAFFWPAAGAGAPHKLCIAVALMVLAAINLAGVRQAAGVAVALTVGKIIPLLLFVGVGVFFADPSRITAAPAFEGDAFTRAVLMLVFAFGGFESAIVTAGEMKDPRRDAPFALVTGIAAATILYVLIQAVCVGTLPGLAESKRPLADAAASFAGPSAGAFIAFGAFVSTLGTLNGTMLSAPRLLFAMAERGHLPRWLGHVHPRWHTPHTAILAITAGGLVLGLTGTFTYLIGLNVITRLLQYLAGALAVLVLRRRAPTERPAFVAPAAPVLVPLTVIACVWLIARSSPRELRDIGIALVLGLVLLGAGTWWSRRGRRAH